MEEPKSVFVPGGKDMESLVSWEKKKKKSFG